MERLLATDQVADASERPAEVALDVLLVASIGIVDAIGQPRERQRLKPDAPGSGQRRKEQPFPAEQARLDPADADDVVVDRGIESDEASGVDLEPLAGAELHRHDRPAAV